jgi:hypothetical protein
MDPHLAPADTEANPRSNSLLRQPIADQDINLSLSSSNIITNKRSRTNRSSQVKEESEEEDEDSDESEEEIVKRTRGRPGRPRKMAASGSSPEPVRTPRGRPSRLRNSDSPDVSTVSSMATSSLRGSSPPPASASIKDLGNRHTKEFPCDDELFDAILEIMKSSNLSDLSVNSIKHQLEKRFKVCQSVLTL